MGTEGQGKKDNAVHPLPEDQSDHHGCHLDFYVQTHGYYTLKK
jgi:hypothetical protein